MLTVAAALPWEAAAVARLLRAGERTPWGAGWAVEGTGPDATPVRVIMTGAGPARAQAAAEVWAARQQDAPVLTFGVAGGLAEDVRPGAIVMADRHIGPAGAEIAGAAGAAWADALAARVAAGLAAAGLAVERGASLTVAQGLLTAESKRDAHRRSGARIVQMEDSIWAAAALAAGAPYASARVVLDEAGAAVPAAVMRWHWPPTAREVTGSLLRHPGMLPDLIRLGRRRRVADRRMRALAAVLLAGGPA